MVLAGDSALQIAGLMAFELDDVQGPISDLV